MIYCRVDMRLEMGGVLGVSSQSLSQLISWCLEVGRCLNLVNLELGRSLLIYSINGWHLLIEIIEGTCQRSI